MITTSLISLEIALIIILSIPIIIFKKNKEKLKIIIKIFKESINENKFFFTLSITYSIFTGYKLQNILNQINIKESFSKNLPIATIFICYYLSKNYIKNLLTIPLFNTMITKTKQSILKNSNSYKLGEIQTALSKSENIELLINSIFNLIINLASFTTASIYINKSLKYKKLGSILYIIFIIYLIFSQYIILHYRRKSWSSTIKNNQEFSNKILLNDYIKQGLINYNEAIESSIKEKQNWNNYHIISNLIKIFCTFILITFVPISLIIDPYIFVINIKTFLKLEGNLQSLIGYLDDLLKIIKIEITKEKKYYKNLILKNIEPINENLKNLFSPINFEMTTDIIVITGPNGSGKTTLINMISDFIEYKGEIKKPKTIQLNSNLFTMEKIINLSKGEKIDYFINLIITHNKKNKEKYNLIILDEILDSLSEINNKITNISLITILEKLLKNNLKLIIITHNKQLNLKIAKSLNKTIEYLILKDKKLISITTKS